MLAGHERVAVIAGHMSAGRRPALTGHWRWRPFVAADRRPPCRRRHRYVASVMLHTAGSADLLFNVYARSVPADIVAPPVMGRGP